MLVNKIQIKNFRNLNLETQLDDQINVVVAKNGSGKSNFLDTIYYLGLGKSFKKYSEKNNITSDYQADFASLDAQVDNAGTLNLKLIFSKDQNGFERKRFEIEGKQKSRTAFLSYLYVVLFAPHNINLLGGTPEMRREELDDFISVVDNHYAVALSEYKRVIKNRNMILAKIAANMATKHEILFWNDKLIENGAYILHKRMEILAEFAPFIKEQSFFFDNNLSNLQIQYLSRFADIRNTVENIRDYFNSILLENINKEIVVGKSLYGPHRDDYNFIVANRNLKIFASRGQQRISTMIFKTAMWHYIYSVLNIKGILLLDDIMSELDPDNKKRIENMVESLATQTIITATNNEEFTQKLLDNSQKIII